MITYIVTDDGTFDAASTQGSVTVDEGGTLYLVGEVDEYGTLILNTSSQPGPTPPTPTGDTSITATVDKDGILIIESLDGSSLVDKDGVLVITAQIDSNGDLNINDM